MANFPDRESEIVALGQSIVQGLITQSASFPRSPLTADEVKELLGTFSAARDAVVRQQAQLVEATTAKNASLSALIDGLKAVLRYIENAAESDDQLAHFGWSGRRPPGSQQQAPGQCRLLEAPRQGEGWVFLDWKEPAEGGKPSFYVIEMRELPDGQWKQSTTIVASEATLLNQVGGRKLEYRVYAANKVGKGAVSNSIEVTL